MEIYGYEPNTGTHTYWNPATYGGNGCQSVAGWLKNTQCPLKKNQVVTYTMPNRHTIFSATKMYQFNFYDDKKDSVACFNITFKPF